VRHRAAFRGRLADRIAERLSIRIHSGLLAYDLADQGLVCPVTREMLDHEFPGLLPQPNDPVVAWALHWEFRQSTKLREQCLQLQPETALPADVREAPVAV